MKSEACDAWLCSCIAGIAEYEIDDPCIQNQGTKTTYKNIKTIIWRTVLLFIPVFRVTHSDIIKCCLPRSITVYQTRFVDDE